MLLLLTLVDKARNAHMGARLVHLRIRVRALLIILGLLVLESRKDGLVCNLVSLSLNGYLWAHCLLEASKVDLVQQLNHCVELRLSLLDFFNVDTELVQALL